MIATLDLTHCSNDVISALPQNMRVRGMVRIGPNRDITEFPRGLTARHLHITRCPNLTGIPDNGSNHYVSIEINFCKSFADLPQKLYVDEDLLIHHSKSLRSLPKELIVGNVLEIVGCENLTVLPTKCTASAVDLGGCKNITYIPESLIIEREGNLFLGSTGIETLPKHLLNFKGTVVLDGCKNLVKLPDGIYLDRLSLFECTGLTSLPKRMHIEEKLDIERCENITSLPEDLYVGEYIYTNGSGIVKEKAPLHLRERIIGP